MSQKFILSFKDELGSSSVCLENVSQLIGALRVISENQMSVNFITLLNDNS